MMLMGTLFNAGTIILGSFIGLGINTRLPRSWAHHLLFILGFFLMVISVGWLVEDTLALPVDQLLTDWTGVLISLGIGSLLGYRLRLDERITSSIRSLENRFKLPRVGMAFLNASLLFVVGTLAILGPITEALTGNLDLLLLKSLIDGVAAMLLATTLGYGVIFSAISVLIYQSFFYGLGFIIAANVDTGWLPQFTLVGHIILIALALSLMQIKTSKPVNVLPSLLVVVLIYFLF
jgi:uncharacterized membrane protein YqgA involved in biofilm formation